MVQDFDICGFGDEGLRVEKSLECCQPARAEGLYTAPRVVVGDKRVRARLQVVGIALPRHDTAVCKP